MEFDLKLTGTSFISARTELTLGCPDDIERVSDIRSATAVVSWTRHNFHVTSSNDIRYVSSYNIFMAALRSRCGHYTYIFALWFLLLSFFLFLA